MSSGYSNSLNLATTDGLTATAQYYANRLTPTEWQQIISLRESVVTNEIKAPGTELDIKITNPNDTFDEEIAEINHEIDMPGYLNQYWETTSLPTGVTVDDKKLTMSKTSNAISTLNISETALFDASSSDVQKADVKITAASANSMFFCGLTSSGAILKGTPPFQANNYGFSLVPYNSDYKDASLEDPEQERDYYLPRWLSYASDTYYHDSQGTITYSESNTLLTQSATILAGGSKCSNLINIPTSGSVWFGMSVLAHSSDNQFFGFNKWNNAVTAGAALMFGCSTSGTTQYFKNGTPAETGWAVSDLDELWHCVNGNTCYAMLYRPSTNSIINSQSYDLTSYSLTAITPAFYDSNTVSSSCAVKILDPCALISQTTRIGQRIATYSAGDIFTLQLTGTELLLYKNGQPTPGSITIPSTSYKLFAGCLAAGDSTYTIDINEKNGMEVTNLAVVAKAYVPELEAKNIRCNGISQLCAITCSDNLTIQSENTSFGKFEESKAERQIVGSRWDPAYVGNAMTLNNVRDTIGHASAAKQYAYGNVPITVPNVGLPKFFTIENKQNKLQPRLFNGIGDRSLNVDSGDSVQTQALHYGYISDGINTLRSQVLWDFAAGGVKSTGQDNYAGTGSLRQVVSTITNGCLTATNHECKVADGARWGAVIKVSNLSGSALAIGTADRSLFSADVSIPTMAGTYFIDSIGGVYSNGVAATGWGGTLSVNDRVLLLVDNCIIRFIKISSGVYTLIASLTLPAALDYRVLAGSSNAASGSWDVDIDSWRDVVSNGSITPVPEKLGIVATTFFIGIVLGSSLYMYVTNTDGRVVKVGEVLTMTAGTYYVCCGADCAMAPQGFTARIERGGGITLPNITAGFIECRNLGTLNLTTTGCDPVRALGNPITPTILPTISALVNLLGTPDATIRRSPFRADECFYKVSIKNLSVTAPGTTSFKMTLPYDMIGYDTSTIQVRGEVKGTASGLVMPLGGYMDTGSVDTVLVTWQALGGTTGAIQFLNIRVDFETTEAV